MTQGTSEISVSVVTDTICKAAMVTAQRFALRSFGETKLEPVLVARITERALFSPQPLLAGDTMGKENSLL